MGASIRAETGPAMRNPSNAGVLRGCTGCPAATQFRPCGTLRASLSLRCYSALPSWPSWLAWPRPAFTRACELRRFAPPRTNCWRVCSKPAAVPSSSRGPACSAPATPRAIVCPPPPPARSGAGQSTRRDSAPELGAHALPEGVVARSSRSPIRFSPNAAERQQRHPNYLRPAGNRATARHRHQRERPRSNLGGGGGGMPLIRHAPLPRPRLLDARSPARARGDVGGPARRSGHAARQPAHPRRRVASDRRHATRARHGRPHSRQSARRVRSTTRAARIPLSWTAPSPAAATRCSWPPLDRAHFASAARALFAHQDFTASVEFAPAIGPAAPDRYVISLRWRDSRDATDDTDAVALQVLAQLPVAG